MKGVVYDRKSGKLGVRRSTWTQEKDSFDTNEVVDIFDPINWQVIETVPGHGGKEYDWKNLPDDDPRVQLWKLFDIIEGGHADWEYSGQPEGDGIFVEEAYVNNRYEVFELIRRAFGIKKSYSRIA